MTAPATVEQETATQFISMFLASYDLPFQILSPTPYPGKIGLRLDPEDQYCLVHAVSFLAWMNEKFPSLDRLRAALNKKRRMNHKREGK
ncbi:hypothetical protein [uncultured Akkermansia sp.]|uniref:hypothetical protein n=1 Tax=uncultured Akkermansia sp. TaxID=512294 RepID=UPI00261BE40D|nr:hypothetical protein [uncultured Akkermansia sp.]